MIVSAGSRFVSRCWRRSLFAGVLLFTSLGCIRVSPPSLLVTDADIEVGAGGAIASGISATGGDSASCGSGETACPTGCATLDTDTKNCGTCGHDCLSGGSCEAGQCLPTVLTELTASPTIFGLDSTDLYFAQYNPVSSDAASFAQESGDALHIEKTAVRGAAAPIVAGLLNSRFIGVVDSLLFWNRRDEAGTLGAFCDMANCGASIAFPFGADGQVIRFHTPLSRSIAVYSGDSISSPLKITWYAVAGKGVVKMASSSETLNIGWMADDLYASGDAVYWHSGRADSLDASMAGTLYRKGTSTDSQTFFKLADNLDFYMFFLDANPQSVLLTDIMDSLLYRVPLPDGLGSNPPQALTGIKTFVATEDENGVYWFDSDGNLYRCSPTDCSQTQTVLAKGQSLNGNVLLQDATALYWAVANPYRIMRIAK